MFINLMPFLLRLNPMIKVKHPLEHCNEAQEDFLMRSPQELRRINELIFSYANATYRYHHAASEQQPTHQDYEEWLEGLPDNIASDMAAKGFEECRAIPSFIRYVKEKHAVGQDEYVRGLMGDEEYQEYKSKA